jgi:tRNA nucleotidyltransferase (CCA-adding enzyme)
VRARLAEVQQHDPPIEMKFTVADTWSVRLFIAPCRRYGLKPYRYRRQRQSTVMVRVPQRFVNQVLWPEFVELDRALQSYLHEVTMPVIREEIPSDTSEAQEVSAPEALPPPDRDVRRR